MRTSGKYAAIALLFTIGLSFYACVRQPGDTVQTTSLTPADVGITNDTIAESKNTTNDETGGNKKLKVLFLGNSLVYYNDMPLVFESLARSAGKDVFVDSVTQGSATMSLFADKTTDIGATAFQN